MKLFIPVEKWFISQKYSDNLSTYYVDNGRKSHGGFDVCAVGIDKNIYASCDGYIFSLLNKDNPDLMKYRAIYQLVEDNGIFYELVYGHPNKMFTTIGDVKQGDLLGEEGNAGYVFSGGKEITLAEKLSGSRRGAHVHWQLRMVKPSEVKERGKTYLKDQNGTLKKDNKYFEVLNYDNGNKGCIDPEPFIVYQTAKHQTILDKVIDIGKPKITRTLRYGSRGSDVKLLQTLLGIKSDGIFGIQTERYVKDFQTKNNLVVDGIVGSMTLGKLLK